MLSKCLLGYPHIWGVVVGFSNLSAKFKRFLDSLPGDLARLKTKAVNLAGKAFFKVSGGG
ncbi:hypothetical protein SE15_00965 [Thermanaerothrix daxensis]|uniref:Uncharacterized protein n=1 Tax=Thermanaerothrix daxensis TaxID=869279 RepID=A0A0P6Y452_9CHLR|nr:hypothetical protein SE15_00965 [Thermanaerothrix daxensis]